MVVFRRSIKCLGTIRTVLLVATLASVTIAGAARANADVLFEGYAKVMLGSKHVGYAIQRYDFDNKKKEFLATTFLKTKPEAGNLTESTQARATASFKPISYKYTSAVGDKAKLIDASFTGDKMTLTIVEGGKRRDLR